MRPISRRTVLKGFGTAIALPFLMPCCPDGAMGAGAAAPALGPKRVAWVYVPNGIMMESFTPAEVGARLQDHAHPRTHQRPSATVLLVMSGLVCDKANANGDGPGDHARAMAAYLTGSQPGKNISSGLRVGVSADQAIAEQVGHATKFPSLEIGYEEGKQVGSCDSNYPCAYNANLSWRNENTPIVKDTNPQSVFDRLFGNGNPEAETERSQGEEALAPP